MELKLWDNEIPYFIDDEKAETPNLLTTYLVETEKPLPCVVIYAGGAYAGRAEHEEEGYAKYFQSQGIHAVTVAYRTAPNRHPAPLADAQRGIKLVRAHAEEWKIDPEKIVVAGSSAGGHLAAMTLTAEEDFGNSRDEADPINRQSARPNGGILCYPVISVTYEWGHVGSGKNLLGSEEYEKRKYDFNIAQKVSDKTPKSFLWSTSDDQAVNVKNSLIFAEELRNHGIPFELHVYPHGLGLAVGRDPVEQWARCAAEWVMREI